MKTETIARCHPHLRHKTIFRNRTAISRRLLPGRLDRRRFPLLPPAARRKATQSASRCNTRRRRQITTQHRHQIRPHQTTMGLTLPGDGSRPVHCHHRDPTCIIPICLQSPRAQARDNPACPKPATTTRPTLRLSSARNTTSHRHPDRQDKIRTKTVLATTPTTVLAIVQVAVRDIDWPLVLIVKRRGEQVAPGVFPFATPPPLAKSAREHHAAAI